MHLNVSSRMFNRHAVFSMPASSSDEGGEVLVRCCSPVDEWQGVQPVVGACVASWPRGCSGGAPTPLSGSTLDVEQAHAV